MKKTRIAIYGTNEVGTLHRLAKLDDGRTIERLGDNSKIISHIENMNNRVTRFLRYEYSDFTPDQIIWRARQFDPTRKYDVFDDNCWDFIHEVIHDKKRTKLMEYFLLTTAFVTAIWAISKLSKA